MMAGQKRQERQTLLSISDYLFTTVLLFLHIQNELEMNIGSIVN